jgi:anti-sigma factor RsiW
VSGGLDHRELSEALGAYALEALPEEENTRVREHLAGCRECRAELKWLRASVDALPASVPQIEPPPELKANVMQIVEADAELLRAAGERADRPERPERPERRRRWRSVAPVFTPPVRITAAAGAAVITVLVLVLSGGGPATRTIQAQVTGPAQTAGTRASLRVSGAHAQLVVTGLPAPAANHVDELWVQRGSAAPAPAGTFVVRTGSVEVTRAVRSGDQVLVTVEPGRGSSAPTTAPFIVAKA